METHLATSSMKSMVLHQTTPAFGSFISRTLMVISFDPLWACPISSSLDVGIPSFGALKPFKLISSVQKKTGHVAAEELC